MRVIDSQRPDYSLMKRYAMAKMQLLINIVARSAVDNKIPKHVLLSTMSDEYDAARNKDRTTNAH
jgi:hypothetical protein